MLNDTPRPDSLTPELFASLRGYTRRQAVADVTSGLIVGVVALPLAIAFAIASGLSPQYGLFTAIVAGFLISALGGSRVQIGGRPAPSWSSSTAWCSAMASMVSWWPP